MSIYNILFLTHKSKNKQHIMNTLVLNINQRRLIINNGSSNWSKNGSSQNPKSPKIISTTWKKIYSIKNNLSEIKVYASFSLSFNYNATVSLIFSHDQHILWCPSYTQCIKLLMINLYKIINFNHKYIDSIY